MEHESIIVNCALIIAAIPTVVLSYRQQMLSRILLSYFKFTFSENGVEVNTTWAGKQW